MEDQTETQQREAAIRMYVRIDGTAFDPEEVVQELLNLPGVGYKYQPDRWVVDPKVGLDTLKTRRSDLFRSGSTAPSYSEPTLGAPQDELSKLAEECYGKRGNFALLNKTALKDRKKYRQIRDRAEAMGFLK